MLPTLTLAPALGTAATGVTSRFLASDVTYVKNGRSALARVFSALSLGPRDELLVPAYHCGSMVEPALWLGARIVFFHLKADLTPDLGDLAARIGPQSRAVLIPHFFGRRQPLDEIRELCDETGLTLIEDCAHAFFGSGRKPTPGTVGDYAIASTVKFFPGIDGGALCANPPAHRERLLTKPSWTTETRYLLNLLDNAAHYGRMPLRATFRLLERFRGSGSPQPHQSNSLDAQDCYRWFRPEEIDSSISRISRAIVRLSNKAALTERRQANFLRLLEGLSDLPGGRPFFAELRDDEIPYIFPFLLERPEAHFAMLKRRGVPILRWEDIARSDCSVSLDYRLRLLQLPCHQSLRKRDIDWIIQQVREVLSARG
jgi:dTDP-4-amino-4,6-dideoxygalactose transaminase